MGKKVKAKIKTSVQNNDAELIIKCTDQKDFVKIIKAVRKISKFNKVKVSQFGTGAIKHDLEEEGFKVEYIDEKTI